MYIYIYIYRNTYIYIYIYIRFQLSTPSPRHLNPVLGIAPHLVQGTIVPAIDVHGIACL